MNSIAFLFRDVVIYWQQIILVLGLAAGCVLAFALRPFTRIKVKAILLWLAGAFVLSFFLGRLFYYYCNPEQAFSLFDAQKGIFDHHYSVMGMILGTILSAWIVRRCHLVKHLGNLLDTVFPGVILALALIRLSDLFTDTFHSALPVTGRLWQRFPFAVSVTDTAGNISYVFAPFLISFLLLLIFVLVFVLLMRKRIRHPGDLFCLLFSCYALTEIVLESTRYDSLKVHFMLLGFLNQYVSFISFSMFLCGIGLILMIVLKYMAARQVIKGKRTWIPLIAFSAGFLSFGICEYLVQRYTTQAVLLHWLQAGCAAIMAVSIFVLIYYRNRVRKT